MDLFCLIRRNDWTAAELEAGAARADAENAKRSEQLRHIRSYVLDEGDGRVGTMCLYEAVDEQVLRDQSAAADIPQPEIVRVTTTNVVRPDPEPAGE